MKILSVKISFVQIAVFVIIVILGTVSLFSREVEFGFTGFHAGKKAESSSEQSINCDPQKIKKLPALRRLICNRGVDINTDSIDDLMTLPKIGRTKAQLIIESRKKDGKFNCADDLTRIKGIGEKTVQHIAPWLQWHTEF